MEGCKGEDTVRVDGEGEALAIPDVGMISIAVKVTKDSGVEARERVAQVVAALQQRMREMEVRDDDFRTEQFNLRPEYDYSEGRKIVGYNCDQEVTIRVHQIHKLSEVVDQLIVHGGDEVTVENVRPNVLDQTTAESEARALAFQKARAKAEQYAELAGAQCGRAMNIFEKQGPEPAPPMPMMAMQGANEGSSMTPTTMSNHALTIKVEVEVIFKLEF